MLSALLPLRRSFRLVRGTRIADPWVPGDCADIPPDAAHPRAQALWLLALGAFLLALLWLGPLPEMSRRAFSPHMILHLGVMVVAAPLIAIGLNRTRFGFRNIRHPARWALAAALFEMVVVWSWHFPALHEAAAFDGGVFIVQQASFLAAGMAIWMTSFSGRSRAASGIGAFAMLFTFMHMAMLGVLLTLAPHLLYSPEVCMGAFGLDRLDDQQLGGALMAVGGGIAYLVGGMVLAYRFIEG